MASVGFDFFNLSYVVNNFAYWIKCPPNVCKKSLLVLCRKLSFSRLVIPKKSLGDNYLLLFAVAFSVAFYSQSLI